VRRQLTLDELIGWLTHHRCGVTYLESLARPECYDLDCICGDQVVVGPVLTSPVIHPTKGAHLSGYLSFYGITVRRRYLTPTEVRDAFF